MKIFLALLFLFSFVEWPIDGRILLLLLPFLWLICDDECICASWWMMNCSSQWQLHVDLRLRFLLDHWLWLYSFHRCKKNELFCMSLRSSESHSFCLFAASKIEEFSKGSDLELNRVSACTLFLLFHSPASSLHHLLFFCNLFLLPLHLFPVSAFNSCLAFASARAT